METISLEAVTYHSWNNFLDSLFGYRGAGVVEFTAEKPFQVASVEVLIDTSSGRNTTVVLNQPTPPLLYTGSAISLGVNVNDDKRTNIGVFNSSSRSQTVTARVHSGERGADPVQVIRFDLPAKGIKNLLMLDFEPVSSHQAQGGVSGTSGPHPAVRIVRE